MMPLARSDARRSRPVASDHGFLDLRSAPGGACCQGWLENHRHLAQVFIPMPQPRTDEQQLLLSTVRTFVEREVIPVAPQLERDDAYPFELVERMKEMGL